jgi:(S)-citramalyl-CoA lyase
MTAPQRRSVLFVSGLALEGLQLALASGADIVCIDIEDAVPPGRKDEARRRTQEALRSAQIPPRVQLIVRINSLRSLDGIADIRALLLEGAPAIGLLLPKVECGDEVKWAAALADDARSANDLYAIIETPNGLEDCRAIARASPRLKALFFGGFDLSTALGCDMAWEPLLHARARVVHAAASADIDALDSPFPNLDDQEGLRLACERAKSLGMIGKAAKSRTKWIARARSSSCSARTPQNPWCSRASSSSCRPSSA